MLFYIVVHISVFKNTARVKNHIYSLRLLNIQKVLFFLKIQNNKKYYKPIKN